MNGAGIQAPWHGVLETVWLHCDEAQQVGCLRGWGIVCLCRTQIFSLNSQGVVDGGVSMVGVSTAAPEKSEVWLFATLLLQHPNQSQQAASRVLRVMSAFCEATQGVGDT